MGRQFATQIPTKVGNFIPPQMGKIKPPLTRRDDPLATHSRTRYLIYKARRQAVQYYLINSSNL